MTPGKSIERTADKGRTRFDLIVAFAILALLSDTSLRVPGLFAVSRADAAEERAIRVIHYPRMPANTSISINAIRNLQNTNWLDELEIEVQNNSTKPVYFLEIFLLFPDLPARPVEGQWRKQVISLTYCKPTFMQLGRLPAENDVPIAPGKTLCIDDNGAPVDGASNPS